MSDTTVSVVGAGGTRFMPAIDVGDLGKYPMQQPSLDIAFPNTARTVAAGVQKQRGSREGSPWARPCFLYAGICTDNYSKYQKNKALDSRETRDIIFSATGSTGLMQLP